MRRAIEIGTILALVLSVDVLADPLSISCPEPKTILCNQLEDLDVTGSAVASGGCGTPSLNYRDSILAVDSLVIRIWSASDTCGAAQVCFQPFVLRPSTPHVAVLPLENLSTVEEGTRVLQRLLEEALGSSNAYVLIPPSKVDDAVMRGRIRQPVLMDDEQRQKLSQALDAQYFVVGSLLNYDVFQDQYSGPIPTVSFALQLQRTSDGKTVWSESLHAVGNDGEWLFALGVEHDITRLGSKLARKAAGEISRKIARQPCTPNH